jgi:hypothetical protein
MLTARAVEISIATVTLARADEMIEYRAMSGVGTKQTCGGSLTMSALEGRTDVPFKRSHFRL